MNSLEQKVIVIRVGFIILIVLFIVSFIIHMPVNVQRKIFGKVLFSEPIYVDIIYDDYNNILVNPCRGVETDRWLNKTLLSKYCRGEYYLLIPYRDYVYKHCSLNGLIWYFIIELTYLLTINSDYKPVYLNSVGYTVFYVVYSFIILVSLIVCYIYLDKIYRVLEINNIVLKISSVLLSSIFIYMIYSWEFIHLTVLVIVIYYFLIGKYKQFYLFLGLLACLNPIGFVLIFFTIYNGLYSELFVLDKRVIYLITGLTPLYVQTVLSPDSVLKLFTWFMYDYCNNCVYLLVINDPYSQVTKGLAIASLLVLITIYLVLKPFENSILHRYAYIVLFTAAIVSFNLVFTPQTMLLILPLLPPLYIIYEKLKPLIPHYIVDTLNSLIIIMWFRDTLLRKTLSLLGLPVRYNPLSIDSPVQWITQSRNIALIIITIILTTHYLKIEEINTKNINKQLV